VYGYDELRVVWVVFDLGVQSVDVDVDDVFVVEEVVVLDLFQ